MEIGVGTVGVVVRWRLVLELWEWWLGGTVGVVVGVGTVGVVARWRLVLELWEWWLGVRDWCWNCGSGG